MQQQSYVEHGDIVMAAYGRRYGLHHRGAGGSARQESIESRAVKLEFW